MGVSCKLLLIKLSMHTMYITTHHAAMTGKEQNFSTHTIHLTHYHPNIFLEPAHVRSLYCTTCVTSLSQRPKATNSHAQCRHPHIHHRLTPTHPTSGSQNHAHPHPSTGPKTPTKPTYQPPYSQKPLGLLRQGLSPSSAPSQSLKLCKQTVQAPKPTGPPSNQKLPHRSLCNQSKGSCPLTGKQINQPAETKSRTKSSAQTLARNNPTQTIKPITPSAQIPKQTHSSSQILKPINQLSCQSADITKRACQKEDTTDQPVVSSSNVTLTDILSTPQRNSTSQHEKYSHAKSVKRSMPPGLVCINTQRQTILKSNLLLWIADPLSHGQRKLGVCGQRSLCNTTQDF